MLAGITHEASRVAAERKRPENLTAYDLYLLGVEAKLKVTKESVAEAIRLLGQATEVDPQFARAWYALSWAYAHSARWPESPQQEQALYRLQLEAARRAVDLDPMDAEAHEALGEAYGNNGDLARAASEYEKALDINPSSADILSQYAGWASAFGKPEAGVAAADRAIRLNPHLPPTVNGAFAYAYFMVGRYDDALRFGLRVPEESRGKFSYIILSSTLGALGRTEEAKAAVARLLAISPGLSIERTVNEPGWADAERPRLIETMRKAGVPPCAAEDELNGVAKPVRLPECPARTAG
jgi:tetratricopeptide (TPR) repeat protein